MKRPSQKESARQSVIDSLRSSVYGARHAVAAWPNRRGRFGTYRRERLRLLRKALVAVQEDRG